MFALSRAFEANHRRRPSLLSRLFRIDETARQRRALRNLDPHLRRDIGLTDGEIETELRRSVWDAPEHWRR
ncbi:MAG: DUF1127 domain-containing protein [Pseudomonadota bacterium]